MTNAQHDAYHFGKLYRSQVYPDKLLLFHLILCQRMFQNFGSSYSTKLKFETFQVVRYLFLMEFPNYVFNEQHELNPKEAMILYQRNFEDYSLLKILRYLAGESTCWNSIEFVWVN